MDDVIAEQRLRVRYPDGELAPVVLRIGVPKPHPAGDHICSVQAEGLRIWQGPKALYGVGTFHALMIGIRFLQKVLAIEVERGAVLYDEESDERVDIADLFVLDKNE
ncbi:hypothetical protein [Zavarzinella formosa]|uniref:hypothetical protein n=1 Tax=Zavarzinella formosa TaxID=360055 RepID=UPI00030C1E30|nr:hypothetical protein [Zavarzinella formosa]